MTTIRSLDAVEGQPHANLFPESEPKTIRLTLAAGDAVPAHSHPDREIVFYLVDGRVELQLGEATHELTAGEVARFDGDQQIEPRAIDDSTALIVLARRSDE